MLWVVNDLAEWEATEIDTTPTFKTKREWERWRRRFIIGDPLPVPGSTQTTSSLRRMGLVGLYKTTTNDEPS